MKKKFITFPFEVKEVDTDGDKGIIEGYASTFGNMDLGFDIIEKGAFKKTIKETGGKIPILADHNPYKLIGYNLDAKEDDVGLKVRGQLDIENVALAKERFSLAKMAMKVGAKFGLSIGYYTIKEEPDTENPRIRKLKELKLVEYSMVTFPMNTEAEVTGAKSLYQVMNDAEYAKLIAKLLDSGKTKKEILMALEKAAGTITDPSDEEVQSVIGNIEKIKSLLS